MQVFLKVIGGKNDGKLIKIGVPEFIIGRGDTAHLKPQSDLVSRAHCSVVVQEGRVVLRDLESRNGTYLNEQRVVGEVPLKVGDQVRVGRLAFEIVIDHSVAGSKKPKVEGVKEAAARTAAAGSDDLDEESITDWLTQQPQEEQEVRRPNSETKQFMLDETERLLLEQLSQEARQAREDKERKRKEDQPKGLEPGKLPSRGNSDSVDSRDAASQMLRKFFNRR
ncbi:MAG TPA: hypothetical protein DCQ98_00375 [Planctomycetaceae bacterium]|nr:hypothetical protein [Planctomycetaceae bacterium]HRE99428.1 FHA domain-containing protein [Pirellulaceae bacterium]